MRTRQDRLLFKMGDVTACLHAVGNGPTERTNYGHRRGGTPDGLRTLVFAPRCTLARKTDDVAPDAAKLADVMGAHEPFLDGSTISQ